MASSVRIGANATFWMLLILPATGYATIDALLVASNGSNNVAVLNELTGASEGTFVTSVASPRGMVVGPDGNLYVASNTGDVSRFNGDTGAFIDTFVSSGIDGTQGVTFGPDGHLYVSHRDTNSVRRYNGTTGALIDTFATGVDPDDLVFGPDGNLYVVNQTGNNVMRFDGTTGSFIDVFATGGLSAPWGLAFAPDGDLYVSNGDNVVRFDGTTGSLIGVFASGGGLNNAVGIGFGPSGHLYVVSNLTNSVLEYHGNTGAFLSTFASGISSPTKLLFTVPAGTLTVVPALPAEGVAALVGTLMLGGVIGLATRRRLARSVG